MARPTRRSLLGAAGGTVLAGIGAITPGRPDAQAAEVTRADDEALIVIGREAAALVERRKPLDVRWWALPPMAGVSRKGTPSDVELHLVAEAMEPIDERLEALSDRMLELRATTRDAWIAKAVLIRHEIAINNTTREGSGGKLALEAMPFTERLALSLIDDLLGLSA